MCLVRRWRSRRVLDGNLCRCMGYKPILDAAKSFVREDLGGVVFEGRSQKLKGDWAGITSQELTVADAPVGAVKIHLLQQQSRRRMRARVMKRRAPAKIVSQRPKKSRFSALRMALC
ncbi:hypothetical protein L873DRAFT_76058 [Choiromyces venosus 120613-1]|uniref:Uncharacterized protein n=1 Tax=Choiromyces venosus 120613-1 TaxID=1336337 RepID=A0A3N4J4L9_9PEZI|nr:hypothetical protein L873DRAFT_76058 [Choiromyces venosus 120613-1]